MFSSSDTVVTYETQVTIDDVLSNSNVRDGMNKYGWTRSDIIKWLEIMLGVSVDKFLNDNNIEVYLGSTKYELKYYNYRDTANHNMHSGQKNYGIIWLNYVQAIMTWFGF